MRVEAFTKRKKEHQGLTGSDLKRMALLSMLMDHVTYIFLGSFLVRNQLVTKKNPLYLLYQFLRYVPGRIAFPIFCFLLVEGFLWTRSRWNYVRRLFLFALLSELPFDLAFYHRWNMQHTNVFVTLLLSFLMMMGLEAVSDETAEWKKKSRLLSSKVVTGLCYVGVIALTAALAEVLHTDYGAKGVLAIFLLYFFRFQRKNQVLAGIVAFLWEPGAILAFLPISFYNGKRGRGIPLFFYLFYPLHLLLLYGIYRLIY